MPEKSARSAASLRIGLLGGEPADDSGGAIKLDLISVLKPIEESWDRDHRWNPEFARYDSRVREQAAALDQQAARRRKQQDPTGIGMVGHQDAACRQPRMLGIAHHASRPAHDAGTTPQASPLFAAGLHASTRLARTVGLRMINGAASLKALGGSGTVSVSGEFLFPHHRKRTRIGGSCSAIVEGQNLAQFEVEDVARIVETTDGLQAATRLQEEAADGPKQSRAFESEILPISHSLAGLAHYPEQYPAAKGRTRQGSPHLLLGLRGGRNHRWRRASNRSGARNLSDVPQQHKRIVVQSLAFQLQLFQAAIAELGEVSVVERGKFRILAHDADRPRHWSFP